VRRQNHLCIRQGVLEHRNADSRIACFTFGHRHRNIDRWGCVWRRRMPISVGQCFAIREVVRLSDRGDWQCRNSERKGNGRASGIYSYQS
jgi:hypothetical protein